MPHLEKQYVINCDDYRYVISNHEHDSDNEVFHVQFEEWDIEHKEYVKGKQQITINPDEFVIFKQVVNEFNFKEND